eukprot:scaffold61109_cov22-Cyclotella_meneghiniana.AAC.1
MSTKQATVVPPSTSQSTGLINNNDDMDTLLFGTTPSSLFDTISTRIDEQLTAEVSQLPLLPKKKSCHDNNHNNNSNMIESSGEEILMRSLRKVYKKNLDVVEAYCRRNVFTLSSFDKTKRRKVLDRYFMMTDGHEKLDSADNNDGSSNNNDEQQQQQQQQRSKYKPPSKHETSLPTPNQIIQMDTEILKSRHCLQEEKIRGHALSTQISRLEKALHSLSLVRTALCHNSNDDDENKDDFSVLANKLQNAIDGHTEIKGWNEKAETVIRLLDKIKAERVERNVHGTVARRSTSNTGGVCGDNQATTLTVCRDKDEKERRRVWEEMNGEKVVSSSSAAGGSGSQQQQQPQGVGSSQEIATLLKKLREK